jgi:hypothetical protein
MAESSVMGTLAAILRGEQHWPVSMSVWRCHVKSDDGARVPIFLVFGSYFANSSGITPTRPSADMVFTLPARIA